jgi:hypothetical protein
MVKTHGTKQNARILVFREVILAQLANNGTTLFVDALAPILVLILVTL